MRPNCKFACNVQIAQQRIRLVSHSCKPRKILKVVTLTLIKGSRERIIFEKFIPKENTVGNIFCIYNVAVSPLVCFSW